METARIQIHANCRLRRVYFADRIYSGESLCWGGGGGDAWVVNCLEGGTASPMVGNEDMCGAWPSRAQLHGIR